MKISIVAETFYPEVNGVAMTMRRTVKRLAEYGHRVQVIRPNPHEDGEERQLGIWEEVRLPGYTLPYYKEVVIGLPTFGYLSSLWKKDRPDVVHVVTEGPLGFEAVITAKFMKIPVISSFHTNFHEYGKHYGVGWLQRFALSYLKLVHNLTRLTLTPDQELIRSLENSGFKNVKYWGRGVDTELFSPRKRSNKLREKFGVKEEDLLVVQVSRTAVEKNVDLSVRAFRAIKQAHPTSRFIFVGGGPKKHQMEKMYPEVDFVGWKIDEELATYYASGDLFLFASETETFGNVVTEALGSGLIVLTYNYAAGQQFIRNEENGFVVEKGNEDHFIESSLSIAERWKELNHLRINARETACSIPWSLVFEGYLDQIEGAVKDTAFRPKQEATANTGV
ncbi:MAG: glycosyltransferase family 1 protein [Verrucomicrobiota bacterium]